MPRYFQVLRPTRCHAGRTRDARRTQRHAIELRRDNDGRHADVELRRRDGEIEIADRELDPLVPRNRVQVERAVEIPGTVLELRVGDVHAERRRETGRATVERDERLLDGAVTDDLPRAVEREDDGFVENLGVHFENGEVGKSGRGSGKWRPPDSARTT